MHRRKAPRLLAASIATLTLALLAATPALAAPGAVEELDGCRTSALPATDDQPAEPVSLGFTANLFGAAYTQAFVNDNGNITFDAPLPEYVPYDFRVTGPAIIAPFFADVDTRAADSGLVHYGIVESFEPGVKAFCVIWDDVGYFERHADKLNRFQLLLVDRGTAGVDVIFNYDRIAWETGDITGAGGFGGVSAAAGYAAGDGDSAHALLLDGSLVNGGLLDSNAATSLAGLATAGQPAGRWIFQLRNEVVTSGQESTAQTPATGSQTQAVVNQTVVPPLQPRKLASVASARLLRGRTLAVKVACAASASRACAGVVTAKVGRKAVGSRRYKGLGPGSRRTVKVALNRRGRTLVKQRAKQDRKLKFVLTVKVTDAAGTGVTAKRTISVRP